MTDRELGPESALPPQEADDLVRSFLTYTLVEGLDDLYSATPRLPVVSEPNSLNGTDTFTGGFIVDDMPHISRQDQGDCVLGGYVRYREGGVKTGPQTHLMLYVQEKDHVLLRTLHPDHLRDPATYTETERYSKPLGNAGTAAVAQTAVVIPAPVFKLRESLDADLLANFTAALQRGAFRRAGYPDVKRHAEGGQIEEMTTALWLHFLEGLHNDEATLGTEHDKLLPDQSPNALGRIIEKAMVAGTDHEFSEVGKPHLAHVAALPPQVGREQYEFFLRPPDNEDASLIQVRQVFDKVAASTTWNLQMVRELRGNRYLRVPGFMPLKITAPNEARVDIQEADLLIVIRTYLKHMRNARIVPHRVSAKAPRQ